MFSSTTILSASLNTVIFVDEVITSLPVSAYKVIVALPPPTIKNLPSSIFITLSLLDIKQIYFL